MPESAPQPQPEQPKAKDAAPKPATPSRPGKKRAATTTKKATTARKPTAKTTPKKTSSGLVKAITHAGEPLDLSAVKKTHVLRVGLKDRKGRWVGKLVNVEPAEKRLTVQVTWMKEPRTVSFADVASVEARTADKASKFGPVRLDA